MCCDTEAVKEPEAKAEAEGVPGAEAEQAKPEQSKRKKALVKKQKKKAEALAAAGGAPAKKARWRDRHTAFLGQLPYNATAETIEHHFR